MGLRGWFVVAVVSLAGCGDNSHPGGGSLLISPQFDLRTTESGDTAMFTVQLTDEPSGPVVVDLTSMNGNEGTVSPATLTFGPNDYDRPRTVTVTGVDDARADGNVAYTVRVTAPRIGAVDLEVTNLDNDVAGFAVSPLLGLMTSEAGMTATFAVNLMSEPAGDVIVPVASSDESEGVPDKTSLTFTPENWDAPQQVSVTGQPDIVADGPVDYVVVLGAATSADSAYHGVDPDDVAVVNVDDELGGITVSAPISLATSETGTTDSFMVVLQTPPAADVTIAVSTTDTSEANISTTQLVFTPANWNQPRMITVTGQNDFIDDGDQPFTIALAAATSADATYNGIDPADVPGINSDNDTAGITVMPTSGLDTSEAGTTDSFTVVLDSQPTSNVTISVTSSDTSEATTSVAQLVFTPANWKVGRTVTVTGVNDFIKDGDQPFTIVLGAAISADTLYNTMTVPDVTGINTDDEVVGVIVSPTSGLITTEGGGTDVFTVLLASQPSADVTIGLTSSDTKEGTVSPMLLTFTPANWNQPQTVTVTGVDDKPADGDKMYTIVLAPAVSVDSAYSGEDAADVTVTNIDDDTAGFTVEPSDGLIVSEFGDSDTFTIMLNTAPAANVTISLTTSDPTEGSVQPTSVTFTPANWNVPQTVTVTGINDNFADGNIVFSIVTGAAQSLDPAYNGLNPADAAVTNVDNDTAQVFVKARKRLIVSENGQSTTFRVRLTVQPTATVTCTLSSSDTTEGTVSPTTLVFQPNNFGFVTVTVTGVNDNIVDGDVLFTIVLNACTSADPAYNGYNPRDVAVLNRDND